MNKKSLILQYIGSENRGKAYPTIAMVLLTVIIQLIPMLHMLEVLLHDCILYHHLWSSSTCLTISRHSLPKEAEIKKMAKLGNKQVCEVVLVLCIHARLYLPSGCMSKWGSGPLQTASKLKSPFMSICFGDQLKGSGQIHRLVVRLSFFFFFFFFSSKFHSH